MDEEEINYMMLVLLALVSIYLYVRGYTILAYIGCLTCFVETISIANEV